MTNHSPSSADLAINLITGGFRSASAGVALIDKIHNVESHRNGCTLLCCDRHLRRDVIKLTIPLPGDDQPWPNGWGAGCADSPKEAYEKALPLALGRSHENQYANPGGKLVTCRFRGLADLNLIYEPLEDGAELAYTETINRSEADIKSLVRVKGELGVFASPHVDDKPDYSSGQIVAEVYARWPRLRKG